MSLSTMPNNDQIADSSGRLTSAWQSFMESINFWLAPVGSSGSTSSRPQSGGRRQLYIGQAYFDTTLGFPVYVKSLNPTVWVDGSGTTR